MAVVPKDGHWRKDELVISAIQKIGEEIERRES
jgi:hypothetical protein